MCTSILKQLLRFNSATYRKLITTAAWCRNNSNIVYSAQADIVIPDVTIPEFVFTDFSRFPKKISVECGLTGRKYTYEEVRVKSRNLSTGLRQKLKLRTGDVIAILLPNVPEYSFCLLGALEGALKLTLINPAYTPEEIRRQIQDADVKAIITLGKLWPVAQAAAELAQTRIPIITIKTEQSESTPEGAINLSELTDSLLEMENTVAVNPNEVAVMLYSSGTTGMPKGVEHTHRSLIANVCQLNTPDLKLTQDTTDTHQDVAPGLAPWFHSYGLTAVFFNHLHTLCKTVSLPRFTPELFVKTLVQHTPNLLHVSPPTVHFMSDHPSVKRDHLKSIRVIMSGGAPLGALAENRFLEKAGNHIDLLQGYGLTESSGTLITAAAVKRNFNATGTVGEIVSNSAAKIVPADNLSGDPLGPNQPGELLIRGPHIMKGYHNKSKETKESFVDGWLRTGDFVYYDEHKLFYIAGRLKELIKVKAFQVAPAELEDIIRKYPDVSDAAVIGIPHDKYGEVPKAYVVPKPNVKVNISNLMKYVADRVASYKQIRGGVEVVEVIPKNSPGKILRKNLKLLHEMNSKCNS